MKFTEMHVTEDAEVWDHPEQFLAFIKNLAVESPVLLLVDDLSDTEVSFFWDKVIEIVLEKLGIELCEGCDGSGKREQYYPPVVEEDCPDCNGDGWVKR